MVFLLFCELEPKISSFGRKFLSTLPELKTPSIFSDKNVQIFNNFNPLLILKDPQKSRNFSLRDTKIVHGYLRKANVLDWDIFDANTLLNCYFRGGNVNYAFRVFDKIPEPNIVSWNALISGCNKNFLFGDSWRVFRRMHGLGLVMDEYTYGGILSACGSSESLTWGEQVYALSMKNGFFSSAFVRTGMIELFSVSCRFEDALRVFGDAVSDNVASWSSIISAAVNNQKYWTAVDIFKSMCSRFMIPSQFTLSSILTACTAIKCLQFGKGVQGWIFKCGLQEHVMLGTSVLDFYAKSGDMAGAVQQFWLMPNRNVISWSAMISGFAQNGDFVSAVRFFEEMRYMGLEINNYTVTSILLSCSNPDTFQQALQIHCWILKAGFYSDPSVKASLINTYSKLGAYEFSEIVFSESENVQNLRTFATMLSTFAQTKDFERAIYLFQEMLQGDIKPEKFCTASVLAITDSLTLGRQIHGYTVKTGLVSNLSVGSSLAAVYSKCGCLEESYDIFKVLERKDTVSCASMIAAFVKNGSPNKAIDCFKEMLSENITPNEITISALLSACSALFLSRTGKEIHSFVLRNGLTGNISIDNAMVNMYSKSGIISSARRVYDMMATKDHIVCSALLSGYAHNGSIEEALCIFCDMLVAGMQIDAFTMSSVLGSIAHLGKLGLGCQCHALITKIGLDSQVSVGSSLLIMYSKFGSIDDCRKSFEQITKPDAISWTAVIASYAQHGNANEALQMFELMKKSLCKPDSVTFTAVLSACSHGGMVEDGYFHFGSMKRDFGIEPGNRHYSCMVDLLGRAGRLKEAERFILEMPVKPDAMVWGTLLAACKVHGDVDVGRFAAEKVLELDPDEAGTYVSLSNICADMGLWEDVLKLRSDIMGPGVKKEAGWSSL